MLKMVKATNQGTLHCKVEAMTQVHMYLKHAEDNFYLFTTEASVKSADLLYAVLPIVDDLTASESESSFANSLADRIIDTVNEVGLCHSKKVRKMWCEAERSCELESQR